MKSYRYIPWLQLQSRPAFAAMPPRHQITYQHSVDKRDSRTLTSRAGNCRRFAPSNLLAFYPISAMPRFLTRNFTEHAFWKEPSGTNHVLRPRRVLVRSLKGVANDHSDWRASFFDASSHPEEIMALRDEASVAGSHGADVPILTSSPARHSGQARIRRRLSKKNCTPA